jgi:hypothetical protein
MRTALVVSFGVCVMVAGVVIGLIRRGRSSRDDLDAVSGQWIAEHVSKTDQTWP